MRPREIYKIEFFTKRGREHKKNISAYAEIFEVSFNDEFLYEAHTFLDALEFLINEVGEDPRLELIIDNLVHFKDTKWFLACKTFVYTKRYGPLMTMGINFTLCPKLDWDKLNNENVMEFV